MKRTDDVGHLPLERFTQKSVASGTERVYYLHMNDGQRAEKMTPTYKKYAKYIGKLFWEKHNDYNYEVGDYVTVWKPIMIAGLQRRYGTGRYMYTIMALGANVEEWRASYRSECGRINNQISYGNLVPINPANPVPPTTHPK